MNLDSPNQHVSVENNGAIISNDNINLQNVCFRDYKWSTGALGGVYGYGQRRSTMTEGTLSIYFTILILEWKLMNRQCLKTSANPYV